MDDTTPKSVTIACTDIIDSFGGWHYSSASVTNTTLGAIAVKKSKTEIEGVLKKNKCFQYAEAVVFAQRAANTSDSSAFAGTQAYLEALQTDIKASTRPLVQVPTITVTGSSYNATPTVCYVRTWLKATPLFSVVRLKAWSHLALMYEDWKAECGKNDEYLDDTQASQNENCLAIWLKTGPTVLSLDLLTHLQHVVEFDVALANLYIATLVHHMVCNDGGTQFRDKLGRTTAANQVALAAQGVLFLATCLSTGNN